MRYLLLFLALACCAGCGGTDRASQPGPITEFDEAEMDAAIARARGEVDSFIAELNNPTGDGHAVKIPITDDGEVEFFWLVDVAYQNGKFAGVINNEPAMVANVKLGDRREVGKAEIADWMYLRDGKMYGNYTMRPLLKSMPEDQAKKFEAMFATP